MNVFTSQIPIELALIHNVNALRIKKYLKSGEQFLCRHFESEGLIIWVTKTAEYRTRIRRFEKFTLALRAFWKFWPYNNKNYNSIVWKARWDPRSWSMYSIVSILTDPGSDLGHPMVVIMTGQLQNHDRPMFAIIAGTTYSIAIPCYQSFPLQLITWSPMLQDIHLMLQSWSGQEYNLTSPVVQSWRCKDFNSDLANISILTPQGFQSWLGQDFNSDFAGISILTSQGFSGKILKEIKSEMSFVLWCKSKSDRFHNLFY